RLRAGEAIAVGELLAVVDDLDAEPGVRRESRQVPAHVAGPDDVERGRRRDRVDVDLHLAAADEARLLDEIVVEIVLDERGLAGGDRLARLSGGVVLVAAAANRADGPAVGVDAHLGPRPPSLPARRPHHAPQPP